MRAADNAGGASSGTHRVVLTEPRRQKDLAPPFGQILEPAESPSEGQCAIHLYLFVSNASGARYLPSVLASRRLAEGQGISGEDSEARGLLAATKLGRRMQFSTAGGASSGAAREQPYQSYEAE